MATLLPACVYGEDALGPSIVAATYTLERINFIEQSPVSKDGLEDAVPKKSKKLGRAYTESHQEKSKSSILVALIEVGFDQPMYVHGNRSLSLANIQETRSLLRDICTLKCHVNSSILPSRNRSTNMVRVVEFNAKNLSSPLGLTPIPHSNDKAAALLPFTSIIETRLRENVFWPETNVYRATLLLRLENFADHKVNSEDEDIDESEPTVVLVIKRLQRVAQNKHCWKTSRLPP